MIRKIANSAEEWVRANRPRLVEDGFAWAAYRLLIWYKARREDAIPFVAQEVQLATQWDWNDIAAYYHLARDEDGVVYETNINE